MQHGRRQRRNAVSNILPLLQRLGLDLGNPDDVPDEVVGEALSGLSLREQPRAGPAMAFHGPAVESAGGAMDVDMPAAAGFQQLSDPIRRDSSVRSDVSTVSDQSEQWEESPFGLTRRRSSRHSQRRSACFPDELSLAAAEIQARAAAGTLGTSPGPLDRLSSS
eukprot:m.345690 g.345690  ORF g.345690 m.345690 type:complete len:164 (-) comp16560_c4_seq2:145-636(-)